MTTNTFSIFFCALIFFVLGFSFATILAVDSIRRYHSRLGHILQRLYDSEINFEISTFWDSGFAWKLGDEMNGYKEEGSANKFDIAVYEIASAARKHYPNSAFVIGKEECIRRYRDAQQATAAKV